MNGVFDQPNDTMKNSEISPFMLDFRKPEEQKEYLFLTKQPAKADETIQLSIHGSRKNLLRELFSYWHPAWAHIRRLIPQKPVFVA